MLNLVRQVSFRIMKSPPFGTMRCLCTDRWCHFNWCKSRVVASVVHVPDLQLALTLSCGLIVRNGETGGVDDFHDEARASLIPSYGRSRPCSYASSTKGCSTKSALPMAQGWCEPAGRTASFINGVGAPSIF